METRVCRTCKVEKKIEDFAVDKRFNWVNTQCKKCGSIQTMALAKKRAEIKKQEKLEALAKEITWDTSKEKRCTKCGTVKKLDEFNNNKGNKTTGKSSQCKICNQERYRVYCENNVEKVRESGRRYYENNKDKVKEYRIANKDKIYAASERWREANPEKIKQYVKTSNFRAKDRKAKWAAEHPESMKESSRKWGQKNQHIKNQNTSKYRASKKNATVLWDGEEGIEQIKSMYKLAKQKTAETGISWHVDHIVPIKGVTVCGLHCLANLQVIPREENISKSNKHWPDMWEPWPEDKKDEK